MAEIVTMPKLGFDMAEGTLVRWVRKEGEKIEKGAILAEIETDKATVEVESTYSGILHKFLVAQGSSVPVGTPIAIVAAEGETVNLEELDLTEQDISKESLEKSSAEKPMVSLEKTEAITAALPSEVRASPLARKMASQAGLDLSAITGSGPDGRIVKKDIEKALASDRQPGKISATSSEPTVRIDPEIWKPRPEKVDKKLPIDKLRAAIGRRMVESKQQFPHFYVTHAYDVGRLIALRKEMNKFLEEGQKISVNDFVVKATALALRRYPNLNAFIAGENLLQHARINIGVAVSVPGGLLTVVCKDADQKSVNQISSEVKEMAGRARAGKVRPEDIEGSTFSISNLGMYNLENFAAIINPPEAAILAVGSAMPSPMIKDGEVVAGVQMKATLSVDHRVSDGVEAAKFMQSLADYLENPLGFLMF